MTGLNELGHVPEQEGEKQGGDVGAVHVRIRHQDDFVIAQAVQ